MTKPERVITEKHPDVGDVSLEIYADGLVIRPAAPLPQGLGALTLQDDLGTLYQHSGDVSGGTKFEPRVPSEAAWLRIFVGQSSDPVVFDLRGGG